MARMIKIVLAYLGVFILFGCGSKAVRYEVNPSSIRQRPVIIFVPGYYGTALADEQTGERFFLTAWGAMFGQTPLAIAESDLGVEGARHLRPDGILEYIRVVPGVFSLNAYGEALSFLRDRFGDVAEIVPFDYDWRQELSQTAAKLDSLVRSIEKAGSSRILIFSHSMGGLVATYYLRYGTQDPLIAVDTGEGTRHISAAVIAGTPFGGTPTVFRNLQNGTAFGTAKTPLAAESLGTFPSMYEIMSSPDLGAYRNSEGLPLGNEVWSPEMWRKGKFGLFRRMGEISDSTQAKRESYVSEYLTRAERFSKLMRASDGSEKGTVPMLYFVGTGTPTLSRIQWAGKDLKEESRWLYDHDAQTEAFPEKKPISLVEDGDGTVPTLSATPTAALLKRLPGRVIVGKAAHREMFEHEEFLREAEAFLKQHLAKP